MDHNAIRLKVAKEYFERIKKEMDGSCLDAYVFGSVARGEAKESSDVDMILILQRPTNKERFIWNTIEELAKRNNSFNFAKNSHKIFEVKDELEEKYGFPISIYTRFEDAEPQAVIPLCEVAFVPFQDLIADAIHLTSNQST